MPNKEQGIQEEPVEYCGSMLTPLLYSTGGIHGYQHYAT